MPPLNSADRARLSVAMIVRDSEALLPGALDSVRAIADEIVVVETGSVDNSAAIARQYGAKVVQHAWQEDFSAARNQCWDEVAGEWILWLDAGERLSDRCADSLRRFVESGPATDKAYLMMVEVPPHVTDAAVEQVGRVRLVPNRSRLRFSGRLRESLAPRLAELGMSIELGPWRIHRTRYDQVAEVKQSKARRDLKLIEIEVQERGPSARLLLATADACAVLGDQAKASNWYRQAISIAERGSTEMLSAYYGLLTSVHPSNADDHRQLEVCIEGLDIFPYDAQLLCAMGSYLQAQGHLGLSQRSYRAAHQFGQVNPETWHIRGIGEIAAICLSLNLQLAGEDPAALQVLEEASVRHPRSVRLARRRLDLHIKAGRADAALIEVDRLKLDRPQRDQLQGAVRGACLASQSNWIPALAYLGTAYSAGCRESLCLRWYTIALFSTGSLAMAQQVLSEWAKTDPECAELAQYRANLAEALADHATKAVGWPAGRPGAGVPAPHLHIPAHAANGPQSTV